MCRVGPTAILYRIRRLLNKNVLWVFGFISNLLNIKMFYIMEINNNKDYTTPKGNHAKSPPASAAGTTILEVAIQ